MFKTSLRVIFHGAALGFMVWGYRSIDTQLGLSEMMSSQFGGHSLYLTMQGLAITCLTMVVATLNDIWPESQTLYSVKRALTIITLPLCVVISSIYWSLLLLFPSLIIQAFPSDAPDSAPVMYRLPLDIDFALHGAPALTMLIDFFFLQSQYSSAYINTWVPRVLAIYGLGYTSWIEYCSTFNNNTFPYPFLTQNNFPGRVAIYVGAMAFGVISFRFINYLHRN